MLHGVDDYLPVAVSEGHYLLLRDGADGSWQSVVAVSPDGDKRVVAHAGYIAGEAVRGRELVYVAEQSVDGGSRVATIWRINWLTGRVLGHVTQLRPFDSHATGGLDDVMVAAATRDGVWVRRGLFWSGRSGDLPVHRPGFVRASSFAGNELEFHIGNCWKYVDPTNQKAIWRRCGTHVHAGLGVTPDGRYLLLFHHNREVLQDTRSGTTTKLPARISYGAWEGHGKFMGEESRGGGDRTLLFTCSARSGECLRFGAEYGEIDTFTSSAPGDT